MRRLVSHAVAASLGFWAAVLLAQLERRVGYVATIERLHP